ncbi:MAG: tetratricopeptide repeat protein [Phycisphaerales bacterium]
MRTIRIFISSPNDVREERSNAEAILKRLVGRFHARARIEFTLWESEWYEAKASIPSQLPRPGTFDIVVLILWSTLGSARTIDPEDGTEHESGTRFEVIDAVRGAGGERPKLFVYRRMSVRPASLDMSEDALREAKTQWEAVKDFFAHAAPRLGIEAFNPYETPVEFAEKLEKMLAAKIEELLTHNDGAAVVSEVVEPFKGLAVFQQDDYAMFFGRTLALYQVVSSLIRQAKAGRPFVLIFGHSGVGKSSFVRAGLVPHLTTTRVISDVAAWRSIIFEPSDSTNDLIGGLSAALCAEQGVPELAEDCGGQDRLAAMLRDDPGAVVPVLRLRLGRIAASEGGGPSGTARLLLLVDPFEEIFTRKSAEEDQRLFARALRILCSSGLVWVLGTIRSDYYERCSAIEDIRVLKEGDGQYHLPPLTFSELHQVVTEPARLAGVKFESRPDRGKLEDEIINAAMRHTDPLPLLSYTLQQLFERSTAKGRRVMTFEAFDELGGLAGALSKRADEARNAAFRAMKGDPEAAWNTVFGSLVSIDRDGQRVRLYARPERFEDPDSRTLQLELDKARLLITDKDDQNKPVISIAHEAMLREWQTLSAWIAHREVLLRLHAALKQEAEEWASRGKREEDLSLHDAKLAQAEQFMAQPQGLPVEPVVAEFVRAAVERRDRASRRQRARDKRIAVIMTVAFVIAAGTAVYAYREKSAHTQTKQYVKEEYEKQSEWLGAIITGFETDDPLTEQSWGLMNNVIDNAVGQYLLLDPPKTPQLLRLGAKELEDVAKMMKDRGLYVAAARVQERAVDLLEEANLSDKAALAKAVLKLGGYLYQAGAYGKAMSADEQAQRLYGELQGSRGPDTLKAQGYVAGLHRRFGRNVRAARLLQEVAEASENRSDIDPTVLADIYENIGEAHRSLGQFTEAERAYKRQIELLKDLPPKLALARGEYGILLQYQKKLTEAEPYLREALQRVKHERNGLAAAQEYKLARVLIDLGQCKPGDEAEKLLADSYSILRQPLYYNQLRLAKCLEARAKLYLCQGNVQDARRDAETVLRYRREDLALFNSHHPDIIAAYDLLAECYEAAGEPDEAAKCQSKRDELEQQQQASEEEESRELERKRLGDQ